MDYYPKFVCYEPHLFKHIGMPHLQLKTKGRIILGGLNLSFFFFFINIEAKMFQTLNFLATNIIFAFTQNRTVRWR